MFDQSPQLPQDSGYQLHIAKVTRVVSAVGAGTVYVTAPTLAPGFELGPCLSMVPLDDLEPGTDVVVSSMNDGEQQLILGILQPSG